MTPKKTLKKWFSNFMKPAQEHFAAWIDSFWHKSEKIPMSSIDGLDRIVEGSASAGQLLNHINDTNAHRTLFDQKVDKENGKGLSANDFTNEHKQKLENLQPTNLQPLQDKIAAIETTLTVDDTDLDTLQEIITQVKANKNLEQLLAMKVDKEVDKGLSTNDFTNEHRQKLEDMPPAQNVVTTNVLESQLSQSEMRTLDIITRNIGTHVAQVVEQYTTPLLNEMKEKIRKIGEDMNYINDYVNVFFPNHLNNLKTEREQMKDRILELERKVAILENKK